MLLGKKMLEALWELLYPPRQVCPLCSGTSSRAVICPDCQLLLAQYAREHRCPVCGLYGTPAPPGSTPSAPITLCPECRVTERPFQLARSVGPYEGPLRDAVHRFKYRGHRELARPLGALMADVALGQPAFIRTRGLVPVPLFEDRQRQRGFNQALLLARELEEPLAAPVLAGIVVKTRSTPSQTGLSRPARMKNLARAFTVTDTAAVAGKTMTIIDDVLTTGTTVSVISHLLRQAGASSILVLTLAGPRYYSKK